MSASNMLTPESLPQPAGFTNFSPMNLGYVLTQYLSKRLAHFCIRPFSSPSTMLDSNQVSPTPAPRKSGRPKKNDPKGKGKAT